MHLFKKGCKVSGRSLRQKITACLSVFIILMGMFGGISPAPVQGAQGNDRVESISIHGDGVAEEISISPEELRNMEQTRQLFSASNTFPTRKVYATEGVLLSDLLAKAGIKEEAKTIMIKDGGNAWTFSRAFLEEERYYYPNIMEDSEAGKVRVEPVIALLSVEGYTDYEYMNANDGARIIFGQRALSEQTTNYFVKSVDEIEVTTEDLGQNTLPSASVNPGVVEMGTEVELHSYEAAGKIYYTLDGNDPDLNSPIFNLSTGYQPNPPIKIIENTTIKARVYNFAKSPSEVATFEYTVGEGSVNPVVTLNEPAIGQTYYPGEEVTVSGTALNLEKVEITVSKVSGPEEAIYSAKDLAVREGKFSSVFTLSEAAELGTYTISVMGEGMTKAETVNFSVKEDSAGQGGPNDGSKPDQIITSWSGNGPDKHRVLSWRIKKGSGQTHLECANADLYNGEVVNGHLVGKGFLTPSGVVHDLDEEHSRVEFNLANLRPGETGPVVDFPPGARIAYRVGTSGAWSDVAYFTIAEENDDNFSFMYLGDVQDGYGQWGKMIREAYVANPDLKFGILGGDIVDDGNDGEEWSRFFAAATPVFQDLGMFTTPGNHDDTDLYYNSFAIPSNGPENFKGKFYSFNYGNAHFAVLNSNLMGAQGSAGYEEISTWLKDDLTNSGKAWNFVVMHHPPYPAREGEVQAETLQRDWVPVFEECGVDIAFVGHQHVYMRTKPLKDGQIQDDPTKGIIYVMGNSGTKYYEPDDFEYIEEVATNKSTYQTIAIDGLNLTLKSMDLKGEVIDSLSYRKGAGLEIDAPMAGSVYFPGESIQVQGTSWNTMRYSYRLLDSQGEELKNGTYSVNNDGTFSRGISTGRDYAWGKYTIELMAEGASEAVEIPITLGVDLRISGEGVENPYTLSYEELQNMTQTSAAYSIRFRKNYYAPVPAEGLKLADLLEKAELKPEAKLIRFKLTSGSTVTLTREELLERTRYSYPKLLEQSTDGQTEVEPLLSLRSGTVSGGALQDNSTWLNLIMGQRSLNDENVLNTLNPGEAAGIKEIEVLTEEPQQSVVPLLYPPGASMPAGANAWFAFDGTNTQGRIYYTLDGSTPSHDSILALSNGSNVNHILQITEDTTIKAIAYVNGEIPSEVVTYRFTVNDDEVIVTNGKIDGFYPYRPVEGAVYQPGETVKVFWCHSFDFGMTYNVNVTDPEGETVYEVQGLNAADLALVQSYRSLEFVLPGDAPAGMYTIMITSKNYYGTLETKTSTIQVGAEEQSLTPPELILEGTVQPSDTLEISFTDDPAWRSAITEVLVNDKSLSAELYSVEEGFIRIASGTFDAAGEYIVEVRATGYEAALVSHSAQALYMITPMEDSACEISLSQGATIMTVNTGFSGFRFFGVDITPVREHEGKEVVVFVHQRGDLQMSINASGGDYDKKDEKNAWAGFNVQEGDIIKVYVLDQLSNSLDYNPIILN